LLCALIYSVRHLLMQNLSAQHAVTLLQVELIASLLIL